MSESSLLLRLIQGDCIEKMKSLPDSSVQAVVTDPPYGLEFMGKDWDAPWKTGAGMTSPGIGDRAIKWPAYGGSLPFGGANPTCEECGGRLRGKKKCDCEEPSWRVDGSSVSDGVSKGVSEALKQKHLFQAWSLTWLKECFRVLKPGGIIKIFGATRMYHRMAAAMEQAGFELRPEHSLEAWTYGCLSEDTEILTNEGWVPYHKAKVGTPVLGFNLETGAFNWQPVKETFEYQYDREAFCIRSQHTDQLVSNGHRVIVERNGKWCFVKAEDASNTETVPILPEGLYLQASQASGLQPVMLESDLGRDIACIKQIHYTGLVWCVRVGTGAFVARRKGKVFVTGNSGFPKSLDVAKALDKASMSDSGNPQITGRVQQFEGYGTALKPGWEPFLVGYKP